jgi:predicted NUDIX family phosphoesterase
MSERVLAVPRAAIESFLQQGFFSPHDPAFMALLSDEAVFLDRPAAEGDPAHKQIIPYFVVAHRGRFLLYRRTRLQGEARLHGKYSLGFGGHINDVDGGADARTNRILAALVRELNEELYLPCVQGLRLVGCINDDSNPVGQVHLGVAFVVEASSELFAVNEPAMIEARWCDAAAVEAIFQGMESWSQLLWSNQLRPLLTEGPPPVAEDVGPVAANVARGATVAA